MTNKAAYIRGLAEGMGIDDSTKEGKIINLLIEMVEELARRSDNTFELKEGTLYPLLHTLEKNKYVKSYTMQTPGGRERKYYHLTEDGRTQLEYKTKEWHVFSEKVNAVLGCTAPSVV